MYKKTVLFVISILLPVSLLAVQDNSYAATASPNTRDRYVSHAEARHVVVGSTRHQLRLVIGPVERHTVRLRPHRRVINYSTYTSAIWEVHFRWLDGRWHEFWTAWIP